MSVCMNITRNLFAAAYLNLYMNLYTCILVFTSLNTHTRSSRRAFAVIYFHYGIYALIYVYMLCENAYCTYKHTYII